MNEAREATERGSRIRDAIKGTGLTQGDAALAIGVSRPSVVQWLAGGEITEDSLARFCKLTGKAPAWIRYGVEPSGLNKTARSGGYAEGYIVGRADALQEALNAIDKVRRISRVAGR